MKKITLILVLMMLFLSCHSTKKTTATVNNKGNLVGVATKQNFEKEPFNTWFSKNYTNYKMDPTIVAALEKHLKGVKIKGFMGTWCGDSKRETPRFYKILEAAHFNMKNLTLATVNRKKQTPNHLEKGLDIIRVPTFIFYKKGVEIGRYVEYPRETMEKDFLKILTGQGYLHSYEK